MECLKEIEEVLYLYQPNKFCYFLKIADLILSKFGHGVVVLTQPLYPGPHW